MELIVEQFGVFVSKHQGRLRVERGRERLAEVPIMHLEQVLIVSDGVGLSSDVVRACAAEGIPIHFLNGRDGDDYGTLVHSGITGMALTKRAQVRAYEDERGLALARAFASGKIQSQANLLRYIAKYRKDADPPLYQALTQAATEVLDALPKVRRVEGTITEEARAALMGAEGQAAARYWQAISQVIPADLGWPGRVTQGASDRFNQALNYGYAVLRAQVRQALLLAGLDPHAGFLHADRPGKPSLSLDLIEEFRQAAVDRTLIGLVNRGFAIDQDDEGWLDRPTRRRLAEKVLERMKTTEPYEGKRQPLRHILQLQARHIATFVRGERSAYEPFVMGW
ncbi:MAG: CRISPR-associated endonuclease Cas1 [Chloroflexota bacterium]|nr:MAG: CRISPR-associated endonuclease Cas1 [Chloroflexota bacterium]